MYACRGGVVGTGTVSGGLTESQWTGKQGHPVEIQGKRTGVISCMGYVYIGLVSIDIRRFFAGKQV
jgi:hypothetical protein